jgi:L-ascorbate metabolism protein UlaG (beta-lactamase superfamily)
MRLTLVRHATLLIDIGGIRILIDPAFDAAGTQPPIEDTPNPRPNPLVGLPTDAAALVAGVDAVIVTHLHQDHLDATAGDLIRELPVYCQPSDVARLAATGLRATGLDGTARVGTVSIERTSGRHGTGALGASLGPVSGVVLRAAGEPVTYVAGDTIFCDDVRDALVTHVPDVVVVNAGGARFIAGDPITMDADGVIGTARVAPDAVVVAVHMDAFNHCLVTRRDLRESVVAAGLSERVVVMEDGSAISVRGAGVP